MVEIKTGEELYQEFQTTKNGKWLSKRWVSLDDLKKEMLERNKYYDGSKESHMLQWVLSLLGEKGE